VRYWHTQELRSAGHAPRYRVARLCLGHGQYLSGDRALSPPEL